MPGSVPFLGAPFTIDRSYGVSNLTDGTSNTLLMSEVKIGQPNVATNGQDRRGSAFNDDWNGCMFNGYTTPNSTQRDWSQGACQYPVIPTNPPCDSKSPTFNAARSYHAGGVNALMGDGSVKFYKDSVSLATWRALSTTAGGEVLDASSY
jgi:prepilin-type processing-associated H-X9-DG protein